MKKNLENPLSLENICESLLKKGLISVGQSEWRKKNKPGSVMTPGTSTITSPKQNSRAH